LSGGALPVENGIVISLARMNRILEVIFKCARVVEPGVINLRRHGASRRKNISTAPDPSSQSICSIAETSRKIPAAHCLSTALTTTILGLEVRSSRMARWYLGEKHSDTPGYDLAGVFVGSRHSRRCHKKFILRL